MIDISIKNLRIEKPIHPWDIKVDRSSWFGNRFKMKNESERDKVCEKYKEWFYGELYDSAMQAELSILKDTLFKYGKLNLFCWCAPKRCHAEIIKEYLLETLKGGKTMIRVEVQDYCQSCLEFEPRMWKDRH